MTRKVKEILKLVAESPYYTLPGSKTSSPFMCYSLTHAKNAGLISEEEKEIAINAIEKYLNKLSKNSGILRLALENCGLPHTIEHRKAIYLDWKNRPKPWKQEENCHDCWECPFGLPKTRTSRAVPSPNRDPTNLKRDTNRL